MSTSRRLALVSFRIKKKSKIKKREEKLGTAIVY